MKDVLDILHRGGTIRVRFDSGTTGYVYVDGDYYPDEPVYMFEYACGLEPICDVYDEFLTQDFLKGVKWEVQA